MWHIRRCGEILHRCRDGVKLRAPAACVDCWLDNKVKSLPVLWTVGGHQANVTYLGGMLEGGRDHLWVIKKKKRTSIFFFFFFFFTSRVVFAGMHELDETHAECDFCLATTSNQALALSGGRGTVDLAADSDGAVCSRVNKCLILKAAVWKQHYCTGICTICYNKCVRHCRWIHVLFMYCKDAAFFCRLL